MSDFRDYDECKLVRVIDGDTVVLDVDLGFHVTMRETFRLFGVNCPEVHGDTRAAGEVARSFTADWLANHPGFLVRSFKPRPQEKYGRWLADITDADGIASLNSALIASGNAKVMDERGGSA
jgi:endonuclease YncB( thermonuclease family)